MNRRTIVIAGLAAALVAAVAFGFYARSASAATPGVIVVAGDVRVDEYVVKAPTITQPTPDYTVGIPVPVGTPPKKRVAPSAPAPSRLPVVSGYLSQVLVGEGAHVAKGQVLARLDTTMLDLGVAQATTARVKGGTDIRVLDENLDKLDDARGKLVDARAKLVKAKAQLLKARAQLLKARASLVATITVLKKQRASVVTSIAIIQRLINEGEDDVPPGSPPLPVILAGLKAALGGLNTGLAGANAGLATMDAGLAKMSVGLATIAKGFVQIRTGFAQLDKARTQLEDARRLAVINLTSLDVAVRLAEVRRQAATIVSPVAGTVTFARTAGTTVMVGAPLVRIRPDGPAHVVTYLTGDQLAQVSVGSRASIGFDSNTASSLPGRVALVGDGAVVPPTSFPTSIVHMTRAVRVTIELDSGATLPPGTPVDVEITTGPSR